MACEVCAESGQYLCPEHGLKAITEKANGKVMSNRKARNRLRHRSEKQQRREDFVAGIKAERMRLKPWCEVCGTEGWDTPLDLHHIVKRSQGPRYDGEKYGVDRPENLSLLCRDCHKRAESNPEWTVTA